MKQEQKNIPAVAYWRMSTDQQEKSIPQQRREMLPRCERERIEIIEEFKDEGISGGGMAKRDAFNDMLRFCQQRQKAAQPIEAVVCFDTSRFSRADSNETGHFIWELRQAGVCRLYTYERWYDFRKEEDRAIFNLVQDFTNNKYLRDHALRVLRGKKDNAAAGYSNGGGLAYATERLLINERNEPIRRVRKGEKIEKPKNWRYVRVPTDDPGRQHEVETVKWLFHEFAYNDVSARGLARRLNERQVPGPAGITAWMTERILAILRNPLYAGDYSWGITARGKYLRNIDGELQPVDMALKRQNNAKPFLRRDALAALNVEPLVDRETFDIVQRKLQERKQECRRCRSGSYVLAGLLCCGCCGGRMAGSTTSAFGGYTYRRYVCPSQKKKPGTCRHYAIREDKLAPCLVRKLQEIYLAPERLEGLRQQLTDRLKAKHDPDSARVEQLRHRIAELDADIGRGRKNLLRVEDDATFATLNEELRSWLVRRERLSQELVEIQRQETVSAEEMTKKVEQAVARLHTLRQDIQKAKPEKVREVLRLLIARVDLFWQAATRPRQWSRFCRGVVTLRPILESGGYDGVVRSSRSCKPATRSAASTPSASRSKTAASASGESLRV